MKIGYLFSGWQRFIIFLLILLYSAIAQSQVYFNNLEDATVDGNWLGLSTIDSSSAYSGLYYSKTDSLSPYGLGIEQDFPDELVRKNTMVLISGYVKSNIKNNRALFVITVIGGMETFLWKGIPLAPVFVDEDIWYYFSDSILVPANLTVESKLKAYLWNQDRNATTGIDDLRIEFKAFNNPTFIPILTDIVDENIDNKSTVSLYTNSYYSINYSQGIKIYSNTNNNIIDNIIYFSEGEVKRERILSQIRWKYTGFSKVNNGKKLNFKASDRNVKLNLVVICDDNSPEMQFVIDEKYKRKQLINRESLIFNYSQPMEEVYRNNRILDTNHFSKGILAG